MEHLPGSVLASLRIFLLFAVLAGVIGSTEARASNSSPITVYCCEPEKGKKICGDLLPPACFGKAYRVMRQGLVIRSVAAPLTPRERAERDARLRAEKEQARIEREQKRQDQALLEAYPSLELLNRNEQDALAAVDRSLSDVLQRQEFLRARKRKLETDIGALPEGVVVPAAQRIELRVVTSELESNEELIQSKELEKQALRDEYSETRGRYLKLRPHESPDAKNAGESGEKP